MNGDGAPRRRLTRAEAKARTRALLLDAAEDVFARKGFSAASVDEIADRAGFSSGALYSNFTGKDQLFTELLAARARGRVEEAAVTVSRAASTRDDPVRAMSALMGEIADHDGETAVLQAEFRVQALRNPKLKEKLVEQVRSTRSAIGRLFTQWREETAPSGSGDDRMPLPNGLDVVVLALFQGIVEQRRIDPDSVPEELYSQALRWLFAGIRATAEQQE